MVHLVKKIIKGKTYLYIEERAWIENKSKRIWSIYLGPEDKIKKINFSRSPDKMSYQTMSFGVSAALYKIAKKIGLIDIIDTIGGKQRNQNLTLGEYILIATINRCCNPMSKSHLGSWFKNDFLSTVFDINPIILNSQTYWNHFQLLNENKIDLIEQEVMKRIIQDYNIDLTVLLFDPTNFYTYIEEHTSGQLSNYGHSKEGRNNLRIINISVLCDLVDGIPLFHRTYKGNVQDAKHFKGVLTEISTRFQQTKFSLDQVILIFDKGNHSPEAFKQIELLNLPFIASLRNSTQKDLLELSLNKFIEVVLPNSGKKISYYETQRQIYDKKRKLFVIYDSRKNKKAAMLFEKKIKAKHNNIQDLLSKLNIKKWRSKEAVNKKLKELIGKTPYNQILKYTIAGSYGQLQVEFIIHEEIKKKHLESLGRTIIFTNVTAWQPITLIQAFRDKYVVEDVFSQLKNPKFLAIRPMYHWNDICIRTHVFCCVLGLLLLSLLRKELKQYSLTYSYESILRHLDELKVTKVFTSATGTPLYKLNKKTLDTQEICDVLKLETFLPK